MAGTYTTLPETVGPHRQLVPPPGWCQTSAPVAALSAGSVPSPSEANTRLPPAAADPCWNEPVNVHCGVPVASSKAVSPWLLPAKSRPPAAATGGVRPGVGIGRDARLVSDPTVPAPSTFS